MEYDELGRVKRKNLHGSNTNSLQTVNYKYNIRDWLTDINDIGNMGDDLFAMNLGYTTGTHPQFNGNISSMQWKTSMFEPGTYNFDYDGANRLTTADYSGLGNYQSSYSYDLNGNILTLNRFGPTSPGGASNSIDVLAYTYNGNKLKTVNDIPGSASHQNNGFSDNGSYSYTNPEYDYDANGNMISDDNKQMNVNEYNSLNLPQQIAINSDNNANAINYLYNAMGTKLRKQTKINGITETTTDYINNFVYEDGSLKYILTPEGRAMAKTDGTFEYQYFLKVGAQRKSSHCGNHLGNTRVTFTQTGDVIQEDSYYPFGMAQTGFAYQSGTDYKNKYLYNGKELQDDFGLGWYDYGARFYDAELGRWHVLDKLSEHPNQIDKSPYSYTWDNPVLHDDPDGNCPCCIFGAILGAAVDYGVQVATNAYNSGELTTSSFTDNINLTSIAVAAGEGFLTSGASIGKTLLVKTTAAVINNVVEVKTANGGLNINVETNAGNIIKNTAIDLTVDGLTKGLTPSSKSVQKTLSKTGFNKGQVASTVKNGLKAANVDITRNINQTVKAGADKLVKGTSGTISTTTQSAVKVTTNAKKDEIKTKTNR